MSNINAGDEYLKQIGVRKEAPTEPTLLEDIASGARTTAQGVFLGWGDELEAKLRSLVQDRPYDEIVKEIRKDIAQFEERNPGIAITTEILGSVAPTALLMLSGGGAPVAGTNIARMGAKLPSISQKIKTALPYAMTESAVYQVGAGEEGIAKDIEQAPAGALWGAGGTLLATPVMHGGQKLLNNIVNFARTKFGDKSAIVVERKLDDIVRETGKTIEEIIADVQAGRLMAENKTLANVLSSMFGEGGEIKPFLTKQMAERAEQTGQAFQKTMQEGMTPDVSGNVAKAWTLGDKEARRMESEMYKEAFKESPELTPEAIDTLSEALNRLPNAKDELDKIYKAKGGLVPFYTVDKTGALKIERMPTLEDAEIVRRRLSETTSTAFRSGEGTLGEALGEIESRLRKNIDDISPTLSNIRSQASNVRKQREAYKFGRNVLTKNADEVQVELDRLIGVKPTKENAQILKAFRMGAMNQLRHKMKEPTYARKVSDEGSKENSMIRTIFPNERIDDLLKKAELAETTQTLKSQVTARGTGGGSPTAGRLQAQARDITTGVARGESPTYQAVLQGVDWLVQKIAPKMDDATRMDVAKVLYSKDPKFVEDALTGNTPIAQLQQRVNDLITELGYFRVMPGAVATQPNESLLGQFGLEQ